MNRTRKPSILDVYKRCRKYVRKLNRLRVADERSGKQSRKIALLQKRLVRLQQKILCIASPRLAAMLAGALLSTGLSAEAQPKITDLFPATNASLISSSANISMTFSQLMSTATIDADNINIFASQSGFRSTRGTFSGNPVRSFDPDDNFFPNELISVTVTNAQSTIGSQLAPALSYQFRIAPRGGSGSFERSVLVEGNYNNAAMGDLNNDGRIDIILAGRTGQKNEIYLNNGDGTFASSSFGTGARGNPSLGDLDSDGYLDVVMATSDGYFNEIWFNNGDGTFNSSQTEHSSTLDVAIADLDGDGDLDILHANFSEQSQLFKNNGDGTFEDVTASTGTGLNGMSWGTVFADFDNDGDEDLFIGNTSDFDGQRSFLYENREGTFINIASDAGAALPTNTYGVASGDFNNDGRVDLFVADEGGKNKLLINMTPASGNWVTIKLEGVEHNRMAIGATVRMVAEHNLFFRTVQGGGSYCSQSSTIVHAGLGNVSRIDTLEVDWGGGVKQAFFNVPVNKRLEIQEGADVTVGREKNREKPDTFGLKSIYPNPFQTDATVEFILDRARHTRVQVFDVLGREVASLVDGFLASGLHRLKLPGDRLDSGVYIVRIEAEGHASIMAVTYFKSN